jgi:hypothetical protein
MNIEFNHAPPDVGAKPDPAGSDVVKHGARSPFTRQFSSFASPGAINSS